MASCKSLHFKGIKIIYTDFEDCSVEQCLTLIKESSELIRQRPVKSVFSLVNAKNMQLSTTLIAKLREAVVKNNPHVKATAVFGLNTFTTMLLETISVLTGRNVVVLDSFEEGRLWLYDQQMKDDVTV